MCAVCECVWEKLTRAKISIKKENGRSRRHTLTHVWKMQAAAQNGCDEMENGNKLETKSQFGGEFEAKRDRKGDTLYIYIYLFPIIIFNSYYFVISIRNKQIMNINKLLQSTK